jgi:flagellar L-ring protein precursor FlgH
MLSIPAQEYARDVRREYSQRDVRYTGQVNRAGEFKNVSSVVAAQGKDEGRARLRFASVEAGTAADETQNEEIANDGGFTMERSTAPLQRDYQSPLGVGEPGVSASLWQESRAGNDLFRDDRAWQPMDLITIVVTERSEGKKEANTEVKQKTTIEAAIESLLGYQTDLEQGLEGKNKGDVDPANLLGASTQNDFKGEGKTNRKGSLTARISAMVAEVLPSGILRVEGKKIISVNSEEQIMVISGLVRPKDITSENEVDSSKIAQLRVDYYGEGTVGESQFGGWLGRIMRTVWPF